MAKDIDSLFKDQLSGRSFEWDEAYWEQAEAVIAAAEKNKRRRRFLFFWLGSGAVLALGMLMVWWFGARTPVLGSFPVLQELKATVEKPVAAAEPAPVTATPVDRSTVAAFEDREGTALPPVSGGKRIEIASNAQAPVERAAVIGLKTAEKEEAVLALLPMPIFRASHAVALQVPEAPLEMDGGRIEPLSRAMAWTMGPVAGARAEGLPSTALLGTYAGFQFQASLSGKWGWSAGLQYAVQQIPQWELERIRQTEMSFGATTRAYVSETRSVHQFELPLSLQYRLSRRLTLEGGAFLQYRLGIRGQVRELSYPKPWERSAAEQNNYNARLAAWYAGNQNEPFPLDERTSVFASGWLSDNGDGAFRADPFAGVQVHLGHLALQGRVHYRFNPFGIQNGENGREMSPLGVSLGVFYGLR
jgi:hypothetical protein